MRNFDYAFLKNPNVIQENRLPAHSDHVCIPNWFEAEQNSFRMSLDGLWKYDYVKNMDLAVVGFEKAEYSCKGWEDIRVPAAIELGRYCFGEISEENNPVASYVKYFTLPVNMRGERVCISFQGVECGFAVWLNGQYVGYSEDPFAPAEFELTPYLKEGENKLAVRVWKWTSSTVMEKQERSHFLGIFRSVYLYVVPRTHIWDLQVIPEVSEDFSEGSLTILTKTCGKGEIEVRLFDDAMQEVLAGVMVIEEGEADSDEIQSGIAGTIVAPKLWSAEEPNLYMLQMEVRDENGDLTEVTSRYVGFCRFDMQEDGMTINGKPVAFKGVYWKGLCSGQRRVLRREEMLQDIWAMKQNNINTVRPGRYMEDSYLNELCDEYGLYVIKEDGQCDDSAWMDWSDEASKTKLQQLKYKYQNISVAFEEKTFLVWNKNLFLNTDVYESMVLLQKDGQAIAKFAMNISVAPMEQKSFDIPQQFFDIMDNLKIASVVSGGEAPEFTITVSFCLKEDNAWGKRGQEVAFGQQIYKKEALPYVCAEPVEIIQGCDLIVAKGNHFRALFENETEGLVSYMYGGKELLKSSPLLNFGNVAVKKTNASPRVEVLENSARLTYSYPIPMTQAGICQICYHVFGDGTIETTIRCENVEELEKLPEFNILFKLNAEYDRLRWYGLGPKDTYVGKMEGGKLGIYENRVYDNMERNAVPRECGNKCGVRFAEITNQEGCGMRFFGDELSFCALPYTPFEIENAQYLEELPKVNCTAVRVASTDVSKKRVFTFCLRGV